VLHESIGIEKGMITTVHDITGTQSLVDMVNSKKKDLRRCRSGMLNLAPTSTGSATAVAEVFPELRGKLNGHAIRVPMLNSSITDMVFVMKKDVTVEEVNGMLEAASKSGPLASTELHGPILGFEKRPLVSTDYTNDVRSTIVDAPSTMVVQGNMLKVYAWYDNEAGYSMRMAELARIVNKRFM
jgi:glyceraldehyde 3-phosphate dehydrogenase|tara:strand:+ start:314 stop:865 length:552 start_codon:yes stop_codon:yes gene_type:complete